MTKQIKTIKDIAEALDISASTVSRVLNKKGYYSPDVAKKINDLIEETGFVYNMSAKSLRYSRSFTIGFMIPDISNSFFGSLALLIEQYFKEKGYSLYICNTNADPDEECKHFNHFAANKVDGILCISQMTKLPVNYQKYNIPIVSLDRYPLCTFPITKVITDDYHTSFQIAEYLVSKGCKNILLVSGKSSHYKHSDLAMKRIQGFEDGLKKHNILLDSNNIIRIDLHSENAIFETEECIIDHIQQGHTFDGIFAVTDRFALGALYGLQKMNVKVPEQVKLIGYDNSLYSQITNPKISTIDRDIQAMAVTACDELFKLIESENKQSDKEIIIPSKLLERGTS